MTQLGPQGGRVLRHDLPGAVGIFGENGNSVFLEIKNRENGFTASGILLCEIDFGRFGVARGGPKMKILQKRQSSKGVFEGFVHFLNS